MKSVFKFRRERKKLFSVELKIRFLSILRCFQVSLVDFIKHFIFFQCRLVRIFLIILSNHRNLFRSNLSSDIYGNNFKYLSRKSFLLSSKYEKVQISAFRLNRTWTKKKILNFSTIEGARLKPILSFLHSIYND